MYAPHLFRWTLALSICFVMYAEATSGETPSDTPVEFLEDAELVDVVFANADLGIAVGEHGVLWRTTDGGRSWTRGESPSHARIQSVSMVGERDAWAVGGHTVPGTQRTQAVVLRSKDGGETWSQLHQPQLPLLTRVKFFNRTQGIAVGSKSHLFPSSLFQTVDGGRSWNPLPVDSAAGWLAADFFSTESGAVISDFGQPFSIRQQSIAAAKNTDTGGKRANQIRFGRGGRGWLVGEAGLILTSPDGGASWTAPDSLPPEAVATSCDWEAVATYGDRVWIAGAPGSIVLHSPDAGKTWSVYRTESSATLRGIYFLDDSRGWAVGTFGTILHTRDGGKSWRTQRAGGKRAAVLALFASPQRLPWEAFGQLAATDGYRTIVECATRSAASPRNASLRQRFAQAAATVGVSSAREHGLVPWLTEDQANDPAVVTAKWNAATDGRASAALEERFVLSIRQWRPEVVITTDPNSRTDDPVGAAINQFVMAAVAKTGDPTAYSDQISQLGLEAWKPKRVFVAHSQQRRGVVEIHRSQLCPRLLTSLAELAETARTTLSDANAKNVVYGFDVVLDQSPVEGKRRDFFGGIVLPPGSDPRRPATLVSESTPELARQVQRRINAQALIERSLENPARSGTWLAQMEEITRGMPTHAAASLVRDASLRTARAGNSEVAAEGFQLLVRKFPQSPEAEFALTWLVQYYGSAEAAWVYRGPKAQMLRPSAPRINPETARPNVTAIAQGKGRSPIDADDSAEAGSPPSGVALAGLNAAIELELDGLVVPASAVDRDADRYATRAEVALDVVRTTQKISPALFATPGIQFPLASAARQAEKTWSGKPLQTMAAASQDNPWYDAAVCELWMAHRKGPPPKKVWACPPAKGKPVLDGKLDDEAWRGATPVALTLVQDAAEKRADTTQAAMMYDDEYLYFGVSCPRRGQASPEQGTAGKQRPRKHDSPMAGEDRVELLIDTDRDYSTWFRFVVDSQGRTAESFWGDTNWNPTWFVAASGDEAYWTCECAIPWTALTNGAPASDRFWAVGVQRVAPGQGLFSWTKPASVDISPEGFGLLRFASPQP